MAKPAFSTFFRLSLLPELRKLERARRTRPLVLMLLGIAALVATVAMGFGYIVSKIVAFVAFIAPIVDELPGIARAIPGLFLVIFVIVLWVVFTVREFLFPGSIWEEIFSRKVVRRTVDFALPGMRHNPGLFVYQGVFRDSEICSDSYFEYYHGANLFDASFPDFAMQFSWVEAKDGLWRNESLNSEAQFRGWFFAVSFPRYFRGDVRIYRDVAEHSFGWFGRSLQRTIIPLPSGLELIHLENASFERYFKVLANDQLDARYILSPALMGDIVRLQRSVREPMCLSFNHNCMYAAFSSDVHYFDTFTPKSFTDPAFTRSLFYAVQGVHALAVRIAANYIMWDPDADVGFSLSGNAKRIIRRNSRF